MRRVLVFVGALALLWSGLPTIAAASPQLSAGFLFFGELSVFVPAMELGGSWPLFSSLQGSAALLYATSGRWGLALGLTRPVSGQLALTAGALLGLDALEGFFAQGLLKARWGFPLGRQAQFFNELGIHIPLGRGFWQLRYGAGLSLALRF